MVVREHGKSVEGPLSARPDIITANYREPKMNFSARPVRSASQRSAVSTNCAHCKQPLMIDLLVRETSNKSRTSASLQRETSCKECAEQKPIRARTASNGRLVKAASSDWSHMGEKIETWFEKARTPDQQVVYNFLEQMKKEDEKPVVKPKQPAVEEKSLDDILDNLKKYRKRFRSARPPPKWTQAVESSSWRVMRHPMYSSPYQFTRQSHDGTYPDEAARDIRIGTVFAPTNRRIGSTFLLHPDWV